MRILLEFLDQLYYLKTVILFKVKRKRDLAATREFSEHDKFCGILEKKQLAATRILWETIRTYYSSWKFFIPKVPTTPETFTVLCHAHTGKGLKKRSIL
jgi:hypothetical protein